MSRKRLSLENNPLFGGPSLAERRVSGTPFRFLPVADIDVDPDQPRRVFDEESLSQLSDSIKEYGVLSPILVRITAGGSYRVVAGERRLRAARMAGISDIPVVIDKEDEQDSDILAKQLVENLQREDLSPMERALAIGHLREKYSLSIRDIAQKLGTSKGVVQRSLEILGLSDDLQAALINGASESKVLLLSQVQDRALRKSFLTQLDSMTRAQLEEAIANELGQADAKSYHRGTASKKSAKISPEDERIIRELEGALSTRVKLERNSLEKQKGRLVLDFYSEQDLAELFKRLVA